MRRDGSSGATLVQRLIGARRTPRGSQRPVQAGVSTEGGATCLSPGTDRVRVATGDITLNQGKRPEAPVPGRSAERAELGDANFTNRTRYLDAPRRGDEPRSATRLGVATTGEGIPQTALVEGPRGGAPSPISLYMVCGSDADVRREDRGSCLVLQVAKSSHVVWGRTRQDDEATERQQGAGAISPTRVAACARPRDPLQAQSG